MRESYQRSDWSARCNVSCSDVSGGEPFQELMKNEGQKRQANRQGGRRKRQIQCGTPRGVGYTDPVDRKSVV